MKPKDKPGLENRRRVVYSATCDQSKKQYVRETVRVMGVHFRGHTSGKKRLTVFNHMKTTRNRGPPDTVKFLSKQGRADQGGSAHVLAQGQVQQEPGQGDTPVILVRSCDLRGDVTHHH